MTSSTIQLALEVSETLEMKASMLDLLKLDTLTQVIAEHLALNQNYQIDLKFVDASESAQLNKTFRDKNKPTNVLSFPAELPEFVETDFIGDMAVCIPVVMEEAKQQDKLYPQHMQHIILHGILHLLGYDHIKPEEAEEMESLEIAILAQLGIDDPYLFH